MPRSDFNRSGYRPLITSKEVLDSDLDLSLISAGEPGFRRLFPLTDLDAVKASVKNLILTSLYDRPFQPEVSSTLTSLLFENAEPVTQMRIRTEIERVISVYEPRVRETQVEVSDMPERNAYSVTIEFSFADGTRDRGTFTLQRLR